MPSICRSGVIGALLFGCGGPGLSSEDAATEETGEPDPLPTPECDPLLQDCAESEACYFVGGDQAFACEPRGTGAFADPCEYSPNCDIGMSCLSREVVAGCANGFGCCTTLCEVGSDPCPNGLECERLYDGGAPPGFEGVGLCVPG